MHSVLNTYGAKAEIGRALNLGEMNPDIPLPELIKPNTGLALVFYAGQRFAKERRALKVETGRGIPDDVRLLMGDAE